MPTYHDTFYQDITIDGEICKLYIRDTSGDDKHGSSRGDAIRSGHGFIICYNISSRKSFDKVKQFYHEISQQSGKADIEKPFSVATGKPIIILGIKNDVIRERNISIQEGRNLARRLGCGFAEISATRVESAKKPFFEIAHQLKRNSHLDHKSSEPSKFEEQHSYFDFETPTLTWVEALVLEIGSWWRDVWSCASRGT